MAGVHDLFVAPPVATRVLMASIDMDVAPEPEPTRLTLPDGPPGWTVVESGVFGAWALFLELAEAAPSAAASDTLSLALTWRADTIAIYEGASAGGTALVWRIDVGDPSIAATAAARLAGIPGITVGTAGTLVVLAHASDGQSLDWAFAQ